MTRLEVPYVCPNCEHHRWVDVDPRDEASKLVKCPNCGLEDVLETPDEKAGSKDELSDIIDSMRET